MYFIRYHPLKLNLRQRAVTDREALPYLVVFAGLTALVTAFPMIDRFTAWDAVSGILSIATAVGGILYAYRQNGGRRGYDLIQKYVILGWVVCVRFALVSIPLLLALFFAGDVYGLIPPDSTGGFAVAVIFVGEVVLYQRIGRHIRDTRDGARGQDARMA